MEDAITRLRERLSRLPADALRMTVAPEGETAAATRHDSTFFLALTLGALRVDEAPELAGLRERLSRALAHERDAATGIFNYWCRGSEDAARSPYPDDLDTTSCTLVALADADGRAPGAMLASYVRALTLVEQTPGGPYRTWLAPRDGGSAWRDIDPTVNANIGRVLAREDAVPANLLAQMTDAIRRRDVISPYYPTRDVFRYFLAEWYRGEALGELQEECRGALGDAMRGGVLRLALALAAAARLPEVDIAVMADAAGTLASRVLDDSTEPLCVHAVRQGRREFAWSTSTTLALAYEALVLAEARCLRSSSMASPGEQQVRERGQLVLHEQLARFPSAVRARASEVVARTLSGDRQGNMLLLPVRVAALAVGQGIHAASMPSVAAANALGWTAYTVYDRLVDDREGHEELGIANICARMAHRLLSASVPDAVWRSRCDDAFAAMDAMLGVEQWSWRLAPAGEGRWQVPPILPTATVAFLSDRARGMVLAPLAIAASAQSFGTEEVLDAIDGFLTALIAARQLSDDAHDWESDLAAGRLNAVSVEVFRHVGAAGAVIALDLDKDRLRTVWWSTVLDEVAARTEALCADARRHAGRWPPSPAREAFLAAVLDPLVAGMRKAQRERTRAAEFARAYALAG